VGCDGVACGALLLEPAPQHPRRDGAERQVDEEDPAPRQVVGEDAAQRRADERRDRPHGREVALDRGALGHRVDVPDDRHADRLHRAGSEALEQPERDEAAHRPGESAEQRAEHEQPHAEEHDRLATDDVGHLAVDRHRHGLGQEVDGEQPRELAQPTEVAHDRGHRCGEDRRVDGDQPGAQHHREQDRATLAAQPDAGAGDSRLGGGGH
jgi:hypothetical protein